MNDEAPARRRTYTWTAPYRPSGDGPPPSGLELARGMLDGSVPSAPIAETLDFHLSEVEPGRVVFVAEPGEFLYNPMGTVHGGFFGAILDSAMGIALLAALPAGKLFTTLEFKVNMVRPLYAGSGSVRAEGRVVHQGRRVATTEGRLTGLEDTLYAHATSTCIVLDAGEG